MADHPSFALVTRRAAIAGLAAGAAQALLPTNVHAARDDEELTQETAIEVTARPIPAFGGAPEETRFGALEYRGGVSLYGNSKHFGGLSGLVVEPDGRGLLAVTDVGNWLSAEITYDGMKPTGLKSARMGA